MAHKILLRDDGTVKAYTSIGGYGFISGTRDLKPEQCPEVLRGLLELARKYGHLIQPSHETTGMAQG